MMMSDHRTVEAAIRGAAAAFEAAGLAYGHGTDNALDEAAWLVSHALGRSPALVPEYARALSDPERRAVQALVTQRVEGRRPAAYLTGRAWFAGFEFLCDERALVPRSPLAEFLLDDAFGLLPMDIDAPFRVLDLCTGGGCIGITMALLWSHARIDASDLSRDALALATDNVARHAVGDRVRLLHGSLFEPVRGRYALIVSNPPYVDAQDLAGMPAEFGHEPPMGLGAGQDGLDLVLPMLAGAAQHLDENGWLVVEVGNSAAALTGRVPGLALEWLEFAGGGHGVFAVSRASLLGFAERGGFARLDG